MLIRTIGRASGDHPDLIQRQPTLPHPATQRGNSSSRCATVTMVSALCGVTPGLPRHQRGKRPGTGRPPQLVTLDLGDDLHQAPVDRVALTGQLRDLLEQHLQTLSTTHCYGRRCGQRHNAIIAKGTDKFRLAIRAEVLPSSSAKRHSLIGRRRTGQRLAGSQRR